VDVHDHHVGAQLARRSHGAFAGLRLADQVEVTGRGDDIAQQGEKRGVVVDREDAGAGDADHR
jgi:hypothetical protein